MDEKLAELRESMNLIGSKASKLSLGNKQNFGAVSCNSWETKLALLDEPLNADWIHLPSFRSFLSEKMEKAGDGCYPFSHIPGDGTDLY